MPERISHRRITEIMLAMTRQNLDDLALFEHHKKWTVQLMAMRLNVDQATANRRLRKLVDMNLLARRSGNHQGQGRSPDIYYLTVLGAAVLSQYLQRGANHIKAPSVANPASNAHDLWVLELAIRLGWERIRHREKMTLTKYRVRAEGGFEPTGESISLVPDLVYSASALDAETFIEVEQTTHPRHIRRKYETYQQVAFAYLAEERLLPYLYIIFGDEQQEKSLVPAHRQAMREIHLLPLIGYTNMETVRRKDVRSLDNLDDIISLESTPI